MPRVLASHRYRLLRFAALIFSRQCCPIASDNSSIARENCGVQGLFDDDGLRLDVAITGPVCHRLMLSNCSSSTVPFACPEECPFRAVSPGHACFFRCVPADECTVVNPAYALADPILKTCRRCLVQNCMACTGDGICNECHKGFELDPSKTYCYFAFLKGGLSRILIIVGLLLVALIMSGIVWVYVFGWHPNWAANSLAITKAMNHRHRVKVQLWNAAASGVSNVRSWYPLDVNVHKKDIVGVGLALFYNSILWIACVALLFMIVTFWVYARIDNPFTEDVAGVLATTELNCSNVMLSRTQEALAKYATSNFWALGFLYIVTFIMSLVYGCVQKEHAQWFDAQNKTMSDYALYVTGLPKDETDEVVLRSWFDEQFFKANIHSKPENVRLAPVAGVSICYDYVGHEDKVEELTWRLMEFSETQSMATADSFMEHKRRRDSQLYGSQEGPADLSERSRKSHIKHRSTVGDVQFSSQMRNEKLGPLSPLSDNYEHFGLKRSFAALQKEALPFFEDGDKKLIGSGKAFVIFRHSKDGDAVYEHYCENKGCLKHGDNQVHLREVFSEPPSVLWRNMGVTNHMRRQRMAKAALKICVMIAGIQYLVMRVLIGNIVLPYARAGAMATGKKMVVAGIILGNLNMVCCIMIWFTCWGAGYNKKDWFDICVFFANLILSFANTAMNLGATVVTVYEQKSGATDLASLLFLAPVSIGTENALAENIYMMMTPGMTFINYLMFPLMAGVLPWIWNLFLMRLIYVWGCFPKWLLKVLKVFLPFAPESLNDYNDRNAEKGLEPMEIGLPWDYAANIILPSICFSMLFFLSPFVWKAFAALFMWACFYYCWCRYVHFRVMRACHYSTHRLDVMVNYAWGFPLSIIAAAWCLWGIRIAQCSTCPLADNQYFSSWHSFAAFWVGLSFFLSLFTWICCYKWFVDPLKTKSAEEDDCLTLEQAQKKTLHTWFNCNPVFALKSAFFLCDEQGQFANPELKEKWRDHPLSSGAHPMEIRFFEFGREFLLLRPEERHELMEKDQTGGNFLLQDVAKQFKGMKGLHNLKDARQSLMQMEKGSKSILEFETHLEELGNVLYKRCKRRSSSAASTPTGVGNSPAYEDLEGMAQDRDGWQTIPTSDFEDSDLRVDEQEDTIPRPSPREGAAPRVGEAHVDCPGNQRFVWSCSISN